MLADGEKRAGESKAALAVAEQDFDLVGAPAFCHQVQISIAVKIARRHAVRVRSHLDGKRRAWRRRQAAPPIAQQHGQVFFLVIGESHIQPTIAVEIAEGHVVGRMPGRERRTWGRCESSFAVAEQNRHVAAALIGHNQIGPAIVIHVGNFDASRSVSGSET